MTNLCHTDNLLAIPFFWLSLNYTPKNDDTNAVTLAKRTVTNRIC